MKFYIPHLGDKLKLTKDWTFRVFIEERNKSLINTILEDTYKIPYYINRNTIYDYEYKNTPIYDKLASLGKLHMEGAEIPSFSWSWTSFGARIVDEYKRGFRLSSKISEVYLDYTIPGESILTVDRIYIRKGSPDFDSVTFRWNKNRFWVKLDDANNMEFEYDNNR